MTSQQAADRDLSIWQAHRSLSPQERIELMFFDFLLPPVSIMSEAEYDAQLRVVGEVLREAA